ncbi:MAG: N,N-dimethylformamidase beta subunit family domain-containing protein, partial [Acidimicrobiales bacterium]
MGFSSLNYAEVGDLANLYVSTPSPSFTVTAYRMGWYQGLGARAVWTSPDVPGHVQPACPLTAGVNMVSCDNWTSSLTVPITKVFVQGDYLLKLTGSGGQEGYIPLTVWDPTSQAAYLVVNRTFTEVGWNTYGGYSFYQGTGPCPAGSSTYPVCNRARILSMDRPYDSGYGASDFLGNEYPLIQFCEEHGLDVTYVTDVTLSEHPELALAHKAILSLGHDETWSYDERLAVVNARSQGVNLVFFGAAAVLRHVRLEASPLGPDRLVVDYRDSSADPLNGVGDPMQVTGNTFASPPTNLPPESLTGELYSGYLNGTATVPFVVADPTSWVFKGTGLKTGSQLPGVIMSDVDHLSSSTLMPQNIQVLGHSPIPLALSYTNEGAWAGYTYSD